MIDGEGVVELRAAELALRLNALRGTAVYAAYLAARGTVADALSGLDEELRAFDDTVKIERLSPRDGEQLITDLQAPRAEIVLAETSSFSAEDWALLDRRRSSLAHSGVLVFVTTPSSFEELMRSAPNLASWLGGQAFAYKSEDIEIAAIREQRLAALRAWASRSDEEVIRAAQDGRLPADPEYGEWLVLLGRSDLIGSREP
jgi:hypothetical protein